MGRSTFVTHRTFCTSLRGVVIPLKESSMGGVGCFVQRVFVSGWKRQKGSLGSLSSLDLHQPRSFSRSSHPTLKGYARGILNSVKCKFRKSIHNVPRLCLLLFLRIIIRLMVGLLRTCKRSSMISMRGSFRESCLFVILTVSIAVMAWSAVCNKKIPHAPGPKEEKKKGS